MQAFAARHINNVGIRRRYGDGADGLRRLTVEDGCPGATIVVRFPNSSVDLAHVENIWLTGNAGGGTGTASAKRANHAPTQILISVLRNRLRPTRRNRQENRSVNQQTKDELRNGHLRPLRHPTPNLTA